MIKIDIRINAIIICFGLFVALTMLAVIKRHERNQAQEDSLQLIGMKKSDLVEHHH